MKKTHQSPNRKKLTLKREVVRRLDNASLDQVNGGRLIPTFTCVDWGCQIIDSDKGHSCVDWC